MLLLLQCCDATDTTQCYHKTIHNLSCNVGWDVTVFRLDQGQDQDQVSNTFDTSPCINFLTQIRPVHEHERMLMKSYITKVTCFKDSFSG